MSKTNKNSKQTQTKKKGNAGHKGAIIGLSIALALATGAAVAAPLVVLSQKKGGDTPTPPVGDYHKVEFKDGDTVLNTVSVKDGETVIKPEKPSKSQYNFKDWVKEGETQAYDFNNPVHSDLVLNATWEPVVVVTHTITFHTTTYDGIEGGTFVTGGTTKEGTCNDKDYFIGISKPTIQAKDGYTAIGWTDKEGQDLSAIQVTQNIDAYAKYTVVEKTVALNLSTENTIASGYQLKLTIKGQADYSWKKAAGVTYGQIKNSLPIVACVDPTGTDTYTFSNWSLKKQEDFDAPQAEPGDGKVIGEASEEGRTVLYPQFTRDVKAETVTLTVHQLDGQELKSGAWTIDVPYVEGTTAKTFKQINKPEITQGKKIFGGYYHNYADGTFSDEWDGDTQITPTMSETKDIYIKMDDPISKPEVTFSVEDSAEDLPKYQWVGNHEKIQCEVNTPLANIAVPNVYYKDAKANPDPTIGFTTSYYFTNWYYKKGDEKVPVDEGFTITNSITLYAKFEHKTKVVIETEEVATGTPTTKTIEAIPSTKWVDIVKPEVKTLDETKRFLTGWQATSLEEGSEPIIFDKNTTIGSIPLLNDEAEIKETVHVVPIISDKVHTITFDTTPKVESGSASSVWYQGSVKVGVPKSKETNVMKDVNKPALPLYDEESKEKKNQGFTFDDRWQIKGGIYNDWTDVDEDTVIAAVGEGEDPVSYQMRPIVNGNITITFDPGTDGKLDDSSVKDPISVSKNTKFGEMYKPTVVTTTKDMKFSHWAIKVSETQYDEVTPNTPFDSDTTLYAIYTADYVQSIVHFTVAEKDLKDTDFPAQPINSDNCYISSVTHKSDVPAYVSQFTYVEPTKKKHKLSGWGTSSDEGKTITKIDPTKTVVPSGQPLVLYALFEPTSTAFHKVTIKTGEGVYIEGPASFYVGHDEPIGINDLSHNIVADDATISAWTVGKNLSGWTCNGEPITSATKVTDDMEISPAFTAPENQPCVKFLITTPDKEVPTGSTISDGNARVIDVNALLKEKLESTEPAWAPTVTKPRAKFVEWKILGPKDSEGKYTLTDITSETRVRNSMLTDNTLTLVATFIDESIFEGINGAYFYDTSKEMWAAIQSYNAVLPGEYIDIAALKVQYSDDSIGYIAKSEFKYAVKFGTQTTMIPDNFMAGCNNWDNGGQPLEFPKKIKSIGKNVLSGCTQFNQPIIANIKAGAGTDPEDPSVLPVDSKTGRNVFAIGENFMRNCLSFDSNISINREGDAAGCYLMLSQGFMLQCNSFGKSGTSVLDLTGWESVGLRDVATGAYQYLATDKGTLGSMNFETCLSTTMDDPYEIKLWVTKDGGGISPYSRFQSAFIPMPKSEGYQYYRAIDITGK